MASAAIRAGTKALPFLSRLGRVASGAGIKAQGRIAQQAATKAKSLRAFAKTAPASMPGVQSSALQRAAEAGKAAQTARLGQAKEVGKTVGLYGAGAGVAGGAGYGAHRMLKQPAQPGMPKMGAFEAAFFDELEKIGIGL